MVNAPDKKITIWFCQQMLLESLGKMLFDLNGIKNYVKCLVWDQSPNCFTRASAD